MSSIGYLYLFKTKFIISLDILPFPSPKGWIVTNFRCTSAANSTGWTLSLVLAYQLKKSCKSGFISTGEGGVNLLIEMATPCFLIFPEASGLVSLNNFLCQCSTILRDNSF